ncbi:MAG: PQQ-like beta-propeller repeat protein [Anaerolineaceae bacterium]|nr:PQQ-like beta-propeller repeat protein [Anaerolineaceae bacterium]
MMKQRSSQIQSKTIAILLCILGLGTAVLAACQTNKTFQPTPLAALATTQPSHTPTPTIAVTETAVPTSTPFPTQTPTTAPTPTVTATPFLEVSRSIVSSQGQLAFIMNQALFVETAVGSATFTTFEGDIRAPIWSPQGDRLLFYICPVYEQIFCEEPEWMLYNLERDETSSLTDRFPNLPSGDIGNPTWLNSGEKLLFRRLFEGNVDVLDLNTGSFSTPIRVFRTIGVWELAGEKLLVHDQFGTWANELHVFTLDGAIVWSYPNPNPEFSDYPGANAGVLGFSEEGQLLIILEPDENLDEFAAFYHFDPVSFEIERLFSVQLAVASSVSLSPDGQFAAFYVPRENAQNEYEDRDLTIVDQNGRSYGQRPNSVIVDWRPGGGPVVKERMADGQTQLVYWPLDGSAVQVFVNPTSFEFGAGKWSGDGRYLIYSSVDDAANQSHLTLWQPENGAPMLLQTAVGSDGFRNFAWLPDSTGVYFNLGRTELWKFAVETESLTLIATSAR